MANEANIAPPDEPSTIELLERELARAYRIERALRDVGLALGTTLDLDALLSLILERTTEALEAERATLYLLEEKSQEALVGGGAGLVANSRWETRLVSRVVEGGGIDEIVLRLGEGIAGEVARTGRPANVRDAYADPRFSRAWDERSGFRTRSVLCVPLRSQLGRIIGVIQVLNKRTGSVSDAGTWPEPAFFDEDDEALLAALATQAAVSIEQARLFVSILDKNRELSAARGALEKKVQDLNVLYAIERATARAATREELALAILPEATRALGARTAYVVLADESGDMQLLHVSPEAMDAAAELLGTGERASRPSLPAGPVSAGSIARLVRKLRVKAGEGLVGEAMARGQTILVDDASSDPRRSDRIRESLFGAGEDVGSPCAVVPLLDEHDRAFGALAVLRGPGDRPFGDEDVDLLKLVALNASTGFQLEAARETRALQERLSTIGSLLSGVMHDLRTPMTVISGYVQLLATTDDRQARAEYAETVLRQFDHIAAMTKEVLEFARGESSVLVRRVYLQKFFGQLEEQIGQEIRRRGHPIELRLDLKDRGTARFDEAKVTRAIHNLARNAIEAMGQKGGKLAITVERDPDHALRIDVADSGPGLLPEVEERLFESFVTAGKPSGTGLGLAIVKKIAEDHGGSIHAHSSTDGARFTLLLPQPIETPALMRRPSSFPQGS